MLIKLEFFFFFKQHPAYLACPGGKGGLGGGMRSDSLESVESKEKTELVLEPR